MRYEMPQPPPEPDVGRLWGRDKDTGEIVEIRNMRPGWRYAGLPGVFEWGDVLAGGPVSDVHPDLAALDKYPAPWRVSNGGAIRSAGINGKVILDPTLQCPPCLARLIVRAVNYFAVSYTPGATTEEKR